jgi:hypothetical protein
VRISELPGWPPVWIGPRLAKPEAALLRAVVPNEEDTAVLLAISVGSDWATAMWPVPQPLIASVLELLRQHVGRPVAELGTLELPPTR